jgi:hypothetical protein
MATGYARTAAPAPVIAVSSSGRRARVVLGSGEVLGGEARGPFVLFGAQGVKFGDAFACPNELDDAIAQRLHEVIDELDSASERSATPFAAPGRRPWHFTILGGTSRPHLVVCRGFHEVPAVAVGCGTGRAVHFTDPPRHLSDGPLGGRCHLDDGPSVVTVGRVAQERMLAAHERRLAQAERERVELHDKDKLVHFRSMKAHERSAELHDAIAELLRTTTDPSP